MATKRIRNTKTISGGRIKPTIQNKHMKHNLNFKTTLELDQWIEQYITSQPYKFIKYLKPAKKINGEFRILRPNKHIKKEPWSQYEIQFMVDNWPFKKPEWLAGALRRKQTAVLAMAAILRKKGYHLPFKRNRNGKIKEE